MCRSSTDCPVTGTPRLLPHLFICFPSPPPRSVPSFFQSGDTAVLERRLALTSIAARGVSGIAADLSSAFRMFHLEGDGKEHRARITRRRRDDQELAFCALAHAMQSAKVGGDWPVRCEQWTGCLVGSAYSHRCPSKLQALFTRPLITATHPLVTPVPPTSVHRRWAWRSTCPSQLSSLSSAA